MQNIRLRPQRDRLLLAILGTALGLVVLVAAIAVFWKSGPVLAEIPWYIPMVATFVSLTGVCVAILALGRYQVLRDPVSFWVGMGFASLGIGQIFYVLAWPGLLPDGRAILARLTNTPAFITDFNLTLLGGFLLAAVLIRWPGAQTWKGRGGVGAAAIWLAFVTLFFFLVVSFEQFLPLLVRSDGTFTPLLKYWAVFLLLLFAAGSILSTRYYRRSGDALTGYVAFSQMALVFIILMTILGGKRYDLWWYMQRVVLVIGYLIVLFGLLSEYVQLFRREQEKTQQLEAHSALLQQYLAELERSNRDLQEFAYLATHDLQEPLRKIEMFADKVIHDMADLEERPRERLIRMQQSAGQMRSMVAGLYELARVNSQVQQFQRVELSEVVAQVVEEMEPQIRGTGGVAAVGVLPAVEADREQLCQLFLHLIGNALKFQPPGGTPRVEITAQQPSLERVEVVVQDNGIGFEEEWAERIFEPFQRLVGKDEFEGSGIGLAICRKIVERHQGTLTVTSKPDQGSRFRVTLPVNQNH